MTVCNGWLGQTGTQYFKVFYRAGREAIMPAKRPSMPRLAKPAAEYRSRDSLHHRLRSGCDRISVQFVPPNPNELLSAQANSALRASRVIIVSAVVADVWRQKRRAMQG